MQTVPPLPQPRLGTPAGIRFVQITFVDTGSVNWKERELQNRMGLVLAGVWTVIYVALILLIPTLQF